MLGTIFRKAQNRIQDPAKLKRLISDLIGREQWTTLAVDVKGDAYEGLLEKNAADVKGGAGQYFTPRALIRDIVNVMRPGSGQLIHDPACGTGGFLLAAHDYVSNHFTLDKDDKRFLKERALTGVEIVDGAARLCAMNLFLHGIGGDEPVRLRRSWARSLVLKAAARGSSRRIMIMRFQPANIGLIHRRPKLPRLLLALCPTNGKSNSRNNPTDVQRLTGHSISGL